MPYQFIQIQKQYCNQHNACNFVEADPLVGKNPAVYGVPYWKPWPNNLTISLFAFFYIYTKLLTQILISGSASLFLTTPQYYMVKN